VRPGRNELEVRVANLWVNRLIGDQQPGAQKVTFTTIATYTPKSATSVVRLGRSGKVAGRPGPGPGRHRSARGRSKAIGARSDLPKAKA
jgi:hypothetical protein